MVQQRKLFPRRGRNLLQSPSQRTDAAKAKQPSCSEEAATGTDGHVCVWCVTHAVCVVIEKLRAHVVLDTYYPSRPAYTRHLLLLLLEPLAAPAAGIVVVPVSHSTFPPSLTYLILPSERACTALLLALS